MSVEVKLKATLRKYANNKDSLKIKLEKDCSIGDLIFRLQIPPQEVALTVVNGDRKERDEILNDGDKIVLYPPVGGG